MTDGELADTAALPALPGHEENLGSQALRIPFVGRRDEMSAALEHLLGDLDAKGGRTLVVHGDSGTGKTFFSRELMRRASLAEPDALYLYIDIANDEYQSSRTIISLLKMSLVPGAMTQNSVISIPEPLSLDRFRRKGKARGRGRGVLKGLARGAGAFLGIGSAVGAALDEAQGEAAQVDEELASYLSWVSKKQLVFLAIDNLQFLNLDVRLTIESVLQRVGTKVRLIAVDRTVDGRSAVDPPVRCFADLTVEIQLGRLTAAETEDLVTSAIGDREPNVVKLAADIFTKTGGLAKDVEYCLRQYAQGGGASDSAIEGLLLTIDRLPRIHRQFLVIATLLDGGVTRSIAQGTIRRLATLYEDARLDGIVDELVARDYLRFNSESGNRLRPGHERIAVAMHDLADEELQEEVRCSLINELTDALEAPEGEESETYLLHCLVGVQTARELSRSIHYISRLIQSQYRQDQFEYLVAISNELHEILPLLPEHVLNDLLDAMQKNSSFERGLQLVRQLDAAGVPGMDQRRIHRLKYLTQAYRYDEALALARELDPDEWRDVYRVNALLALDRFDEARAIAERYDPPEPITEARAVMLRNTIVLFDADRALQNLNEAHRYFEREQSHFRLATIDTNRSLVYLNLGKPGDALRSLERAVRHMRHVKSPEIYQAQINLAICAALRDDFLTAFDALNSAALHVPRSLILDQVKIDMNRCVLECANGDRSAGACAESLISCLERIRGLQMPYLQRAIEVNLAVARGETPTTKQDGAEQVSVRIDLPSASPDRPWALLMSIHWRY